MRWARATLLATTTAAAATATAATVTGGTGMASATARSPAARPPAAVAAPTAAGIPKHPRWKSSARDGSWNNGGFTLDNNMWNGSAGPQTIWAFSFHNWGVQSKQAAGNTAIETYPCVIENYNSPRVSSFRTIRNGYSESMPANHTGLHAEAADDVWLNNYAIEVMIWVDRVGRPDGYDPVIGHVTMFGVHYTVHKNGTEYIFIRRHRATTGRTHILLAIQWLMRHGYVNRDATLRSAEFGWEIASTNGKAEDFKVTKYWLHSPRR